MKIACPSCGGEVVFRSRASVFQVCTYCTSMLVRNDLNVESIGKMAQLPPDMSPFQIGTTGRFNKVHFEIVGRRKMVYTGGYWNEWYIMMEDGRDGWLGEAQGFLMVSFSSMNESVPNIAGLNPGTNLVFNKKQFTVDDIKKVRCQGSAGELPVKGESGREVVSVDLSGEGKTFANIVQDENKTDLYLGQYVEFDDLQFQNLREIDGW